MIELTKDGDVHVITMNNGPNVIEPDWQARMIEVLDAVEADCQDNAGLVLTGKEKFFSNGLNVEIVMGLSSDALQSFGTRMYEIYRRLLLLPIPTVAALNGHAFAAGAFIALACDYRLMREDRGWFCISEVDVGVPVDTATMQLLSAKLPPATARDALLTGKRYTAAEAIAAGIADGKAPEGDLLTTAISLAATLAVKERGIFTTLKRNLYGDVGAALTMDSTG
jgi:enoyl-CoA hydratase/carnithine racemase